jgi:predicted transcriptional regulator
MDVLWLKGSASVQQVLDGLPQKPALAYNSVLTTIRILENKGYVKHVKDGRAHIYMPLVERKEATRSEIRHLVSRFFKDSHELLVLNILEDQGVEANELKRLRQVLSIDGPARLRGEQREKSGRREMTASLLHHLYQSADSQVFSQVFGSGFLNLQSFAQVSSARLLNCTAEGIGVALLAWILLRVFGRQNSGTRFAVWFSTLLGIAALPVLGYLGSSIIAGLTASSEDVATKSEITMPGSWALYIFGGWLVMAVAGLIRVAVGFWHLRELRKTCVRIDSASLDPLLRKTLQEFDSPRSVAVCISDSLRVPTAIGFVTPLVVFPAWAMRELSPTELNTILLHELASAALG